MKIATRMLIAGSALMFVVAVLVLFALPGVGLIGNAQAIIGRPFTPLSYAGVARRTAYRSAAVMTTAAVATTAAVETSAAASSAASAQAAQSAKPPPAAAAPPAAPPVSSGAGPAAVGTVVGQLPGGCVSAPVSGVEYYLCNGTYYRAAFQGNNLVYVVAKP